MAFQLPSQSKGPHSESVAVQPCTKLTCLLADDRAIIKAGINRYHWQWSRKQYWEPHIDLNLNKNCDKIDSFSRLVEVTRISHLLKGYVRLP